MAPHLLAPPAGGIEEAPEGHLLARWEPAAAETTSDQPSGTRYEVQVSRDLGFDPAHTVETGADQASFLSGLRGGDTYVRVRALSVEGEPGPWSPTGTVRVSYPAPSLVRNLFVLGSLTFGVLLVAIFLGVRRTAGARQESPR